MGKGGAARAPEEAPPVGGRPSDPVEADREEVWEGLNRPQKEISPRFFYDTRGSELFVEITRLPEYYPTRTERDLLERWSGSLVQRLRPASLLELGAGSARKTRLLLDAMEARLGGGRYLPQDVSADFLEGTAAALRREYPGIQVTPLVGNLTEPLPELELPRPLVVAFLGSTLGNFTPDRATGILSHIAAVLGPDDRLLLGADLRPSEGKTLAELEAAYDDARGITADFNRNALRVLNRRLGTDFQVDAFQHRAFYEPGEGRIEMHLVATSPQTVRLPGKGTVEFLAGETLRTEISCKYDRPTLEGLFRDAGLALTEWIPDDHGRYALVVGAPAGADGSRRASLPEALP